MIEIRLRSNGSLITEHEFRGMHNVAFPGVLTSELLAKYNADPVLEAPQPTITKDEYAVRNGASLDSLGNWVKSWRVESKSVADIAANKASDIAFKWEAIKKERDTRELQGVLVQGNWFHSDSPSQVKWLGLKSQAKDVMDAGGTLTDVLIKNNAPVVWKTMSGVFVPVTIKLAYDVVAAVGDLSAVLFKQAETHAYFLNRATDPSTYDITTGWPNGFSS